MVRPESFVIVGESTMAEDPLGFAVALYHSVEADMERLAKRGWWFKAASSIDVEPRLSTIAQRTNSK